MTEITRPNGKTYRPQRSPQAVILLRAGSNPNDDDIQSVAVLRTTDQALALDLAKAELHAVWPYNEVVVGDYHSTRWLRGKPAGTNPDSGAMQLTYVDDEEHGVPAVVFHVDLGITTTEPTS